MLILILIFIRSCVLKVTLKKNVLILSSIYALMGKIKEMSYKK